MTEDNLAIGVCVVNGQAIKIKTLLQFLKEDCGLNEMPATGVKLTIEKFKTRYNKWYGLIWVYGNKACLALGVNKRKFDAVETGKILIKSLGNESVKFDENTR